MKLIVRATLFAGALLCTAGSASAASPERVAAARLLTQATFGPTLAEIGRTARVTPEAWVDGQLRRAPSYLLADCQARITHPYDHNALQEVWWERAVRAPDQLRQRMAFALSQIMVVSVAADIETLGACSYYDILLRHAFGNFRDLLEAVTLSPAMGRYLSMLGNRKPDAALGIRADENFAREIMQLFTIGLWQLDADGTRHLNGNGRPVATYTQADIENLARVFTGWAWSTSTAARFEYPDVRDWTAPMANVAAYHDTEPKRVLGTSFVAGRTGINELNRALDLLAGHPNVGPFIGRQLIQRFVTSNPTPEYVARVAAVFDDDGSGERGDLGAVLRAILLDPEARSGHLTLPDRFGKLREPVLRITHVMRAFNANGYDASANRLPFTWANAALGQAPLQSPSVFNYYSPDYAPPGELRAAGILAPEMQLATESGLTQADNFLRYLLNQFLFQNRPWYWDPHTPYSFILLDYAAQIPLADDPGALLDQLDLLLLNGTMPDEMRAQLARRLEDFYPPWYAPEIRELYRIDRTVTAIYLMATSANYAIQK